MLEAIYPTQTRLQDVNKHRVEKGKRKEKENAFICFVCQPFKKAAKNFVSVFFTAKLVKNFPA